MLWFSKSPQTRNPKQEGLPTKNVSATAMGKPSFAQPQTTNDPTKFEIKHPSDAPIYKQIDELNKQHKLGTIPFPAPRGLPEPILKLSDALGVDEKEFNARIEKYGQIIFHGVGDTGSTHGPANQCLVVDKMVHDFADDVSIDHPSFCFHLGDVIYSFGEAKYYYDQFYEPFRDYPAPVIGIAGNHDGMIPPETSAVSLSAWLENFCADGHEVVPEAGSLVRTAGVQPGVFFTLEAGNFLRIICLYSNVLEDPGVIADDHIGDSQITYLNHALDRVISDNFKGALIIAHHHPVYVNSTRHGWSRDMAKQIDKACKVTGIWPHAVLSGHAHNYQRFTRSHASMEIPYIVCGNSGHGLMRLHNGKSLRTPFNLDVGGRDTVTCESYDDQDYGYLRVVVTKEKLRIEYHPCSDGKDAKTPDDRVVVDLQTRKLVHA